MTEINLKILLIGNSGVGKTTLLLKYTDTQFKFHETHLATLGIEYKVKLLSIKGLKVKLHIWDTAGQEKFRSVTKGFFRGADGIIFVYDISNLKSFQDIEGWMKFAEDNSSGFEKIVLGNKCDLSHKRIVSKEELEDFGKDFGLDTFETSAKSGINIKEAFEKMCDLIIGDKTENEINELYGPKIDTQTIESVEEKGDSGGSRGKCC